MQDISQVSVFGLYGEDKPDEDQRFVHIERISTRSRQHDWQIKPHTHHGMFQILYLSDGAAKVRIDQDEHELIAPSVVCLPGSVIHGFNFSPETEGWVLTLGESLIVNDPDPRTLTLIEPLFLSPTLIHFSQNDQTSDLIHSMLEKIEAEFNRAKLGRGAILDWMIRIVLVTIRRWQEDHTPSDASKAKRRARFATFRQLLEAGYKDHRTVQQYASDLGLSAPRLNRLCQSMTAKSAGELIQDRLILEAQRLLIYTNASSSMVAFELGFQDPAYFSRFFKRRTGRSPIEFREET